VVLALLKGTTRKQEGGDRALLRKGGHTSRQRLGRRAGRPKGRPNDACQYWKDTLRRGVVQRLADALMSKRVCVAERAAETGPMPGDCASKDPRRGKEGGEGRV